MKIFAIGDLHLGFQLNKPMDIFGDHWKNHYAKIKMHWNEMVSPEDVVLIAGDISWAMKMEEALDDLEWIDALPGRKILVKGNHDYWWKSVTKLNEKFPTMSFLQNNFFAVEGVAICGTRGWILENEEDFTEEDEKILNRESLRLQRSLNGAIKEGYKDVIVLMHYPPITKDAKDTKLSCILEKYPVKDVIYGHYHDAVSWEKALTGNCNGVSYHLVACDYLDFTLERIR